MTELNNAQQGPQQIEQIVPKSPQAQRDVIKEYYAALNPDERVKFNLMVADIFQEEIDKEIKRNTKS